MRKYKIVKKIRRVPGKGENIMNKNARKLIPAVAMLLVSATMLSTASFAWFSMNTRVSSTGMQVNVAAPASLGISKTDGDTFTNAIGGESDAWSVPSQFLGHASSVDGTAFFAAPASTVTTDGTIDPETTDVSSVTNETYAEVYGVGNTVAYIDYTFYIATTSSSDVNIRLAEGTSIAYNAPQEGDDDAAGDDLLPAMRFAVLVGDEPTTPSGTATGNVWFGADNSAATNKAFNAAYTAAPDNTTTNIEAVQEDVDKYSASGNQYLTTIAASETGGGEYGDATKITIRIWVDGEDEACKSSSIISTKSFTVNVVFEIVPSEGA